MSLLIYSGVAVVAFCGVMAVGYLIREEQYWSRLAAECRDRRRSMGQ